MYTQKYKIDKIWKTALLCLLLITVSCEDEDFKSNSHNPEQGVPVLVELNLRIPKFENPQAKNSRASANTKDKTLHVELVSNSLASENNNAKSITRATDAPLHNLWVLQFSADGAARKIVKVSTTENPIYQNQTIEVELFTGDDQIIYLVSMGKQYENVNLSGIKSIDELEATSFDFIRYDNGLPQPIITQVEDIPYCGSCSKITIIKLEENGKGYIDYDKSAGFSGAITMKALVSLLSIDFSYQVENMTPYSISLNNVPTTFAINNSNYKPSQFVNLPTTLLNPADLADGKRITMSWYTASNPQGVVPSITAESDRYFYYKANSTTPSGTAPRDGTYINVWASKNGSPDNYAFYYLFLGRNITSDFNVDPHSHYRYRTDINTADDLNDKRIIYKTLKQSVDFSASDARSPYPALLRRDKRNSLDSHAEMRPIEITALRGAFSVEVLPGSDNGKATNWPNESITPIDPSNSWIKLSTYPNYTAALEAHRRGDPNALATTINLNVSTPGVFRLYLYSDEYEKYVQDNAHKDEHMRSLFIRFTFKTETDKSSVHYARMDQKPAFYLGEFGGEPTLIGGEFRYPKGLAIETNNEYSYMQYLNYMPSSVNILGAYVVSSLSFTTPSNDDIRRTGGYDTYSGRKATIMMAENQHHISPIAAGPDILNNIQEPRYVNGHVDLYQYKYYTNDGFAQRWCYDKNRDKNGNGRIDDDEIVWYMPSIWQVLSIALNCFTTSTDYLRTYNASGINENGLHSITMLNRTTLMALNFYSFSTFNTRATDQKRLRCVRDIEPIQGGPKGVKYYEEDNYPVIDATGLMEGVAENRVNNPDVIIQPGPGDDPSYRGRVKRHYMTTSVPNYEPILKKVSRRFRVAPRDVKVNGDPVTDGTYVAMTWAEASGYATEANTLPITSNKTAIANTGCAAYKGIHGTDPEGSWRLPTIKEAFLIGMMDQAMAADRARTGYTPLNYIDTSNFTCKYWTATEQPDGTSEFSKNRAICLTATAKIRTIGGEGNTHVWATMDAAKSNSGDYQTFARCIYDL